MRPQIYFIVISLLSIITTVATALLLTYCLSILFFWLRIQTADTMARGARAHLAAALENFPWWSVFGAAIAFAFTVWLIKKQGKMYRLKASTIILVLGIVSLLLGVFFSAINVDGNHPTGRQGRDVNRLHQRTNNFPRF